MSDCEKPGHQQSGDVIAFNLSILSANANNIDTVSIPQPFCIVLSLFFYFFVCFAKSCEIAKK